MAVAAVPRYQRARRRRVILNALYAFLGIGGSLAIWQFLVWWKDVPVFVVPAPTVIFARIFEIWPTLLNDLMWTMLSVRNWEQLTIECGWPQDRYIGRMQELLKRVFVLRKHMATTSSLSLSASATIGKPTRSDAANRLPAIAPLKNAVEVYSAIPLVEWPHV